MWLRFLLQRWLGPLILAAACLPPGPVAKASSPSVTAEDLPVFDLPALVKYSIEQYFRLPNMNIGMNGATEYDHSVHNIFHTVHEKRRTFFNLRDAWVGSANAARFAGLSEPSKIQIPVRLNVVFIGFSNEQDDGISKATLEGWFEHLQNVVRHTVVHDPDSFHAPGSHGTETPIEYVYRFQTFDLSSHVGHAFGTLLKRKSISEDDPSGNEAKSVRVLQTDYLEELLDSLLSVMSAKSSLAHGYTLFVLNLPQVSWQSEDSPQGNPTAQNKYGYRDGFSQAHLAKIASDPTLRQLIADTTHAADEVLDLDELTEDTVLPANPLPQREHMETSAVGPDASGKHRRRPQLVEMQAATKTWAAGILEEWKKEDVVANTNDVVAAARNVLMNESAERRRKLLDAIEWERARQRAVENGERVKSHMDLSNCIVDAGVSKKRFGWIDLSAGPFAWGPTVGGSGVRSEETFPRVPELPPLFKQTVPEKKEGGGQRRLLLGQVDQGKADEKNTARDLLHHRRRELLQDAAAVDTADSIAFLHELDPEELVEQLHDMENSLKIMKVLRDGACEEDEDGSPFNEQDCMRYRMKMAECVTQRDSFSDAINTLAGTKAAKEGTKVTLDQMRLALAQARQARARFEAEDPTGVTRHAKTDQFRTGPVDPGEERVARIDGMLSKLAATTAAYMRHVITPPTNLQPPGPSMEDGANRTKRTVKPKYHDLVHAGRAFVAPPIPANRVAHAERVTIHIHIVTDHHSFKPIAEHKAHTAAAFDLYEFKRQLMMLRSPDQEMSFTVQQLHLDDDPILATALQMSITSTKVARLEMDGRFASERRLSLDALKLYNQLRTKEEKDMNGVEGQPDDAPGREISVFLFSMDSEIPVFVDSHFLARAMPEMVFIAQSSDKFWKSTLSCAGKPVVRNLRNPLREALRATLTALSGQLPMHVTNHVHGKPSHDWQWSVGSSPLSCLSAPRSAVSLINIDNTHRAEVASALLAAFQLIREGFHRLKTSRTRLGNIMLLRRKGRLLGTALTRLKLAQLRIGGMTAEVMKSVEVLRFDEALPRLKSILAAAKQYRRLAVDVATMFEPHICRPDEAEAWSHVMVKWLKRGTIALAVLAVAFALGMLALKRRRLKPKIN